MSEETHDNDVSASMEAMLDAYLLKLLWQAQRGERDLKAAEIAQITRRLKTGTVLSDEIEDATAGRIIDYLRKKNWRIEGELPPLDTINDDRATA